jgi:hypothetical protein
MDFTQKHGGSERAALECVTLRLASMMAKVDLRAIREHEFRSLCGLLRRDAPSGRMDCKTVLLRAVDRAFVRTNMYLSMIELRLPLEGEAAQLSGIGANVRSDKIRLMRLRKTISALDHLQCWMLLEFVEEVSNEFSEDLENHFDEVYAKIQATGSKLHVALTW